MNKIGTVDVGVRIEFINKILTQQSREDGSIPLSQYLEVANMEYDKENDFIIFDCKLYEHHLN